MVAAVGADEHLLVRLDAAPVTLRQRIIAREPPGWSGLDHLLDETPRLRQGLAVLGGVHLSISSEDTALTAIVDQIRSARPDELGAAARRRGAR